MKLIVAGGRDFNNYKHLAMVLDYYNEKGVITEIVCGVANGADSHGEYWAKVNGVPIKYFPAKWKKYGKAAGTIRNSEMAKYADALVAFWDGSSTGTKHMIDTMSKLMKPHTVQGYGKDE